MTTLLLLDFSNWIISFCRFPKSAVLRLILINAMLPMNSERRCVLLFSTSSKVLSSNMTSKHDFIQSGSLLDVIE